MNSHFRWLRLLELPRYADEYCVERAAIWEWEDLHTILILAVFPAAVELYAGTIVSSLQST